MPRTTHRNRVVSRAAPGARRSAAKPPLAAAIALILSVLAALTGPVPGATIPEGTSQICDRAATRAARDSGVPEAVMKAITRVETGRPGARGLNPWPWTVNMEGTGRWFATLDEARSYVFSHFKNGARSFDVGCFQINFKWHGQAFRSIDDMFDPDINARYAAGFLAELYGEFGNWSDAAGAYHSRTPEFAGRYSARFDRILAALGGGAQEFAGVGPAVVRKTGSRMAGPAPLITGGTTALGSLVPMRQDGGAAARPLLVLE